MTTAVLERPRLFVPDQAREELVVPKRRLLRPIRGGAGITATTLTSGSDVDGDSTATTASVSCTANRLQLLFVSSRTVSGTPNTPTATGCSRTWVQVATASYVSDSVKIACLRSLVGSSNSGTIAIDFAGNNQVYGVGWSIFELDGVDTSGANGSGAIVQSATNTNASSATLTVTLSAFAAATNATVGGFAWSNWAQTVTPGSGFTELHDLTMNYHTLETEWRADNDTSVDATISGGAVSCQGIAVEIKAAAALAGGASRRNMLGVG